ncbi:MAG: hypothetical protein OXO50_08415, partial [Caldilineaceae bacterium]|nr:hypothetical protein [Caldilineaceae bacterium]
MDGSRSAFEGRHKACPYRRVRREAAAKGGTCDGWKSQRVRGQAQGLPLPARAAGGGRKGALAMDGSRSAYEGRHKA